MTGIRFVYRKDDGRLVEKTAASAVLHGAEIKEKTEVVEYRYETDNSHYVISVKDKTGKITQVNAAMLINAGGPWVDRIRALGKENDKNFISPIAGAHITLKKFLPYSVILQARDRRIFFSINIKDTARVGTTEWYYPDPDTVVASPKNIKYLLDALHHYFPDKNFTESDILSKDAGIRPLLKSGKTKTASSISRDHEIILSPSGMINVVGVKLTDHRRAAQEVVDQIIRKLIKVDPKIKSACTTDTEKL